MKKVYPLLFVLFFPLWVSQAQVIVKSTDALTGSEIQKLSLSTDAPEITLLPYDYRMLQEENKEATLGKPFQFGKAHEMNIGLKDGKWYEEENQRRWKLMISSRDAYSINLIFDKLILPDGAELYIYDQGRTVIMGPINHGNSDGSDEFWTELLPGSGIILELIGHNEALEQASLNISRVIHGFIDTFSTGFGQSAPKAPGMNWISATSARGSTWSIWNTATGRSSGSCGWNKPTRGVFMGMLAERGAGCNLQLHPPIPDNF